MTDRSARRLALPVAALVALATALALAGGCFEVTGMPCPHGGPGCPTGYLCEEGQCRVIGQEGAVARVRVAVDVDVSLREGEAVYFESFLGVGCLYGRDPDEASNLAMQRGERQADVHARVSLTEATEVRVPAGQQAMFVRVPPRAAGEPDVARACVEATPAAGGLFDVSFVLLRANGGCGDSIRDPREECDEGPEGSESCSPTCDSLPVAVDGAGCHGSLAAACMEPASEDGRCLVGWVRDGAAVVVDVRYPDGTDDPGDPRGIDRPAGGAAGLELVALDEHAAAVWRSDGGMSIQRFDRAGQPRALHSVAGSTEGAVATLAALHLDGSTPSPVAGWLTEGGHVVVEAVESGERVEGDIETPLPHGLAATLVGNRIFAAWGLDRFSVWEEEVETVLDEDHAVVALWIELGEELLSSDPFLVPDDPGGAQTEPAVAAVGDGQVLALWTDANNVHEDDRETGIRSRWLRANGEAAPPRPVNSTIEGAQSAPAIAVGEGYAVATWVDGPTGRLMGRFLDGIGQPMARTFVDGSSGDFVVAAGPVAGPAAVVAGARVAYFFWLESPCGARGGRQVLLRMLPRPR